MHPFEACNFEIGDAKGQRSRRHHRRLSPDHPTFANVSSAPYKRNDVFVAGSACLPHVSTTGSGRPMFDVQGKRCSTCKRWKPLEEFNRRSASRDGRQWACRDCNKAYHYKHFDRHIVQIRARHRRQVISNKRRLLAYFLEHPCTDCGEADPTVLEFDHLRDKTANINTLTNGYPWKRIAAEIEKCEVVCANCHRRRTYRRQRSWRVVGFGDDSDDRT